MVERYLDSFEHSALEAPRERSLRFIADGVPKTRALLVQFQYPSLYLSYTSSHYDEGGVAPVPVGRRPIRKLFRARNRLLGDPEKQVSESDSLMIWRRSF
jgi:hypothetical protein